MWLAALAAALPPLAPAMPIVLPVDLELAGGGSNYDDLCFWRDPVDADRSLVFGTSKDGNVVEVFRLATGEFLGSLGGFVHPNNCDVTGDVLITTDAEGRYVTLHRIPDLTLVATLTQGFSNPEGVTVLRENGQLRVFISDVIQGRMHVYDLATLELVRTFPTGLSSPEGIAADDLYQRVYVGDGASGVVRVFSATGSLITQFDQAIDADAEGVALYRCGTQGYVVVSDQREFSTVPNEFEIFDRVTFGHLGTFNLLARTDDFTDATDGIDVFQTPTTLFPAGVFGACDKCSDARGNQFDLVGWDRIATAFGLQICPDGRPPTCGNGVVDAIYEECDGAADAACPRFCGADCVCTVPQPRCGDGVQNQLAEECDGTDDAACPGACEAGCRCPAPPETRIEADVTVVRKEATRNFGTQTRLELDADSPKQTFMRVSVSGVGARRIASAILRMRVLNESNSASDSGGRVCPISSCSWNERGMTWNTRVPLDGSIVDEKGPVARSQVVDFDVTDVIRGDGVYCLGFDSASTDGVDYFSRESGANSPALVLTLAAPVCGDDLVNRTGEECDGLDADVCPGLCRADCTCSPPPTTTTTSASTSSTTSTSSSTSSTSTTSTSSTREPEEPSTTTNSSTSTSTTTSTTSSTSTPSSPTSSTSTSTSTSSSSTSSSTSTTAPSAVCGDGMVNRAAETCDGGADAACPGVCRADCTCGPPLATVEADVAVVEKEPRTTFGTATLLEADADSPKQSFLRVRIQGVGTRPVTRVVLRLQVGSESRSQSVSGGRAHSLTACGWDEGALTWETRPAIDGPVLDTLGAVARGQVVELDVTAAIPGDGVFCLALDSLSDDGVDYRSREAAAGGPVVEVTVAAGPAPTTTTSTSTSSTTSSTAASTTSTSTTSTMSTSTSVTTTTSTSSTTLAPTTSTSGPSTTTTSTSSTTSTTLAPPAAVVEADVSVAEKEAGTIFGTAPVLEVDGDSPKQAFLRVRVTGVGARPVTRAVLLLQVGSDSRSQSDSGGRAHRITACGWDEHTMTWPTRPAIDGPVLGTVGAVARNQIVEFDVTGAIPGDGVFCLALDSLSDDGTDYRSREATSGGPTVLLTVP
jgi:myo-inositol-hexaphosphate 3-phosphohydrolase